jgi:hypothetical protein
MIYRLLGMVSLAIGGIFALVALLVLLPFLNNFNPSLLILTLVFAVLAWVFLGIGWQLFHPPAGVVMRRQRREEVEGAPAAQAAPADDAPPASNAPAPAPAASSVDPSHTREGRRTDEATAAESPEDGDQARDRRAPAERRAE